MHKHATPSFNRRRVLHAVAAIAVGTCLVSTAATASQDTPVRLIVGSTAGSAPDIYARVMGEGMASALGQQVVVENRPGANGNIAAQAVLQQPADGNTLWVGTQSMLEINPSAFVNMPWKPADFVPIVKGVEAPLVLVAHESVPAEDFAGLIDFLKKNRQGMSYASFSPGTPSHFLGYQLSEHYGLDLVHVPYKGSVPQITDLMGGHVKIGFAQMQQVLSVLEGKKLKPLATTGKTRSRFLSDVPTLEELGLPEMTTTIWFGLFAPSGTPSERVAKLTKVAVDTLQQPDVRKKLEDIGFDVSGDSGKSFEEALETQRARWAKLVKATGFSATN